MRVSTIHVRALVDAFESRGFQGTALLAAVGISPEVLTAGYAWVDVEEFDRLLCEAAKQSQDSSFGLHWGLMSNGHQFDLAPMLVTSAADLRTAIESLLRFQAILGDRPELFFSEQDGHALLRFEPFALGPEAIRVRLDFAVTAFFRMLKFIGVTEAQLERVSFTYPRPRPEDVSEYERVFGAARLRFSATWSGIQVDAAVLSHPLSFHNPVLHKALAQQAQTTRTQVLAQDSWSERIKLHLRRALPQLLDMRSAALAVGLSERSLRRHLEREGHSYTQLLEETRRDVACELLAAELARPIKQVAHALAFADVSAFHRAFKRWTGQTPAEYRADKLTPAARR